MAIGFFTWHILTKLWQKGWKFINSFMCWRTSTCVNAMNYVLCYWRVCCDGHLLSITHAHFYSIKIYIRYKYILLLCVGLRGTCFWHTWADERRSVYICIKPTKEAGGILTVAGSLPGGQIWWDWDTRLKW